MVCSPVIASLSLERYNPFAFRSIPIDIFVGDRSEFVATPLRATDQNVQPSLPAIGAKRAKSHCEEACFIAPAPN
jgi:hypothetical protein